LYKRINIKLIFAETLNCKCYIFNLFRQLFNTIIFIYVISLPMLPLLCTRGRCLFSFRSFFIFPFIFNWNWLLFGILFQVDISIWFSIIFGCHVFSNNNCHYLIHIKFFVEIFVMIGMCLFIKFRICNFLVHCITF
jgi:hypothetical protein